MNLEKYSDEILDENQELFKIIYSTDASLYQIIPEQILKPRKIDDIKDLLSFAQKNKKYITFRAAGTSLSGQSLGESLIADISKSFKEIKVLNDGEFIKAECGVIAGKLNQSLQKYNRKFGPDPASINSAMIGGILANNSSGMSSGTENNPYNSIVSMEFILYNGNYYDTSDFDSNENLKHKDFEIYDFLLKTKEKIESNPTIFNKIRNKYELKNTIGYSLNTFLDFEKPIDILSHLLIGSEGTLAFIKSATFRTVPLNPIKSTGFIFFDSLFKAATSIPILKEIGFNVIEIIDNYCLQNFELDNLIPNNYIVPDLTAILVEFQCNDIEELKLKTLLFEKRKSELNYHYFDSLSEDVKAQSSIWKIRKGLLTKVGANREKGTTLIVEDIAFRLVDLPNALNELRALLNKHNYTNTGIYGHGTDGNIHFLLTQSFSNDKEIQIYSNFMDELVSLVIHKYNGSLKAEHGTGRNMAPFVQKEWGVECYQIMKEIKQTIDPYNILNRGVLINEDKSIHLKNIKKNVVLNDESDKCIECGFCESSCPSKDLTVTPRQRITLMRHSENHKLNFLNNNSIEYFLDQTCATDGLCGLVCPVGIDTGILIKSKRNKNNQTNSKFVSKILAINNFNLYFEYFLKFLVFSNNAIFKLKLSKLSNFIINIANKLLNVNIPKTILMDFLPSKFKINKINNFEVILFPSCHSRMLGKSKETNINVDFKQLFDKLNINYYSDEFTGQCCGMAFESKGFQETGIKSTIKLSNKFNQINNENNKIFNTKTKVIFNSSSCMYHFKNIDSSDVKELQFEIFNAYDYLLEYFKQNLNIVKKHQTDKKVFIFSNCSSKKSENNENLFELIKLFSTDVTQYNENNCCGSAGDKFITNPENVIFANKDFKQKLDLEKYDFYISNNTTCELGQTLATGKIFISYLSFLNYLIK